jgi:hypothetical protein
LEVRVDNAEASLRKAEMCLTRAQATFSEGENRTLLRTEEKLAPGFGIKTYIPVSNEFSSLLCLSLVCETYGDMQRIIKDQIRT